MPEEWNPYRLPARSLERERQRAAAAASHLEQIQEDERHAELLAALAKANARSWRRDIAIAAIGAGFGVIGTLVLSAIS